ncbi:MAG: acetate--CoA ligase family protein [Bacillota bacterium]
MDSRQAHETEAAKSAELELFFYPGSIAVIGASQNALKPNGIPLYLLNMFGFKGDVYPVNPKYDNVGGLKCYPSILNIEEPVDLAIIGVAAAQTMDVLKECEKKKVKAVIIFTSGFAETGREGRRIQEEMKALADRSGMRILGPNCLGLLNYYNGNMASFFYNQERKDLVHPKKLSFITQSGGLGGIIYQMVMQLSIGFNYFVSTGNEADVSFAEILNYLVRQDEVSIVAGYLEGLQGDGRLFMEACRHAIEQKKLVTMLKVGRTESGAAAAASHTGAMVGSDQVYDGMFRQYGVPRADDVEQMNALIALHATGRMPQGKKMAIITISGGGGVVVADKCPQYGLEVVSLTELTQQKLREFFPVFGAVGNPVDLTSQLFIDTELFQKALRLVMQDPEVDVGGFFYNLEMPDPEAAKKIIEVYKELKKPLIIFTWPTGQDYAIKAKNTLVQAGVPVIENIPAGLWAISALADWVLKIERPRYKPEINPGKSRDSVRRQLDETTIEPGGALTEWRSKQVIEAYDIPVTQDILVTSPEEAVQAAGKIGYPVAMKIMSPHLLHKTDVGGLELNLNSENEVINAFKTIMAKAKEKRPDALVEGILVQEMLKPGLEVIVGVKNDPIFGPAVVFGLGGVFVEVLKDVSTRVAPLSKEDAREMIEDIKGRALLKGFRGQQERDLEALVGVIMNISRLALELKDEIEEIDINPLILYENGSGAVAADCLVVAKKFS